MIPKLLQSTYAQSDANAATQFYIGFLSTMTPKFHASEDFITEWLPKCLTGAETIDHSLNLYMKGVTSESGRAAWNLAQVLF